MGENYLHEQVENAKKRRDRTRDDLENPRLLTRPDVVDVVYDVIPAGNGQLVEGETLVAVASRSGVTVDVLRGQNKVGAIEGDGAKKLHTEMAKPEHGGSLPIHISNVSKVSGGADARLINR
jgi:hypothetical protein